jgi:hypothetical protein
MKASWKTAGATLIRHSKLNVTQPPIRAFHPPSDIDLSHFDLVIPFGDSLMQTFVREHPPRWKHHRPKTKYHENINSPLNSRTLDYTLGKLEVWHGEKHLRNSTIDVALLLGSSVWDITARESNATRPDFFSDHLNTCRRFVTKVKALYPNVTVFWKGPAALVRTSPVLAFIVHCDRVSPTVFRFTHQRYLLARAHVHVHYHSICTAWMSRAARKMLAAAVGCCISAIPGGQISV